MNSYCSPYHGFYNTHAQVFRSDVLPNACFLVPGLNLALQRPTGQIDVDPRYPKQAQAGKAVDGNTNPDLVIGQSCSHTSRREKPWWAVDLGSEQSVRVVVIKNRGDCCRR